jgi:hypothetical protein
MTRTRIRRFIGSARYVSVRLFRRVSRYLPSARPDARAFTFHADSHENDVSFRRSSFIRDCDRDTAKGLAGCSNRGLSTPTASAERPPATTPADASEGRAPGFGDARDARRARRAPAVARGGGARKARRAFGARCYFRPPRSAETSSRRVDRGRVPTERALTARRPSGTAEACYTSGTLSLDRAPRALRRARTRPRRSRRPALPCACSSPREAPGGTSSPRSPWRTRWWRRPTGTRSPTTGRCTCLSRGPRAGRRRAWCPRRGTSCTSSPRSRSRAPSPPPRTS